jgi:hypothetical protein
MHRTRAIASARAFLGTPQFEILADIVGLEPTGDWHVWEDAEGNRLRIAKNKSVQVYAQSPKAESEVTKDVFRKARPELIAKHSYWVLSLFGNNQGCQQTVLAFLGNNGNLRCCVFIDKVWQMNISPVLLGFQTLSHISLGYIDNESRIIKSLNVTYPKGFGIEEAWASGFPTTDSNLQERIQCHLTNQELTA